jgi:hypothetical protein
MARTTRLDHDALDRLLIQQLDVIARSQALAVGVTDNALQHRLRPCGPWQGLLPGVYMAATGAPTTLQHEMAALLYAGPGSLITGPAALRCHHIRCELTEIVDVLVPAVRQRRATGFVKLHRTTRMPGRIWEAGPGTFIARPDAWWPELGIAVEVDSREWHLSSEDHANTLARGRRMAKYQVVVLRFTPRQIRTKPAEVIKDIKAALEGAQDRPPLKLKTIPAGDSGNGAAA